RSRAPPSALVTGSRRARSSAASTVPGRTARRRPPRRNTVSAHGDGGGAAGGDVLAHLGGDAVRLGEQGLHDVLLLDGLDDLALDEDLALAVAGGDAEIGLARLAGAVDDAAHDGDAQRDLEVLEPLGDLVGEGVDVDLGAAAGGAGDDVELPRLEVQRLQDLVADLDLLHRRGGEGDTDGVADALAEQDAEGD